jgi:hypothetical protein
MHTRLLAALLASLFLLLPARAEDDPMKPVYGTWTVDMDATLKENSALSAEMLRMAKTGYEQNPFTLTITEKEYISKGRQKTMVDLYRVAEVKNGRITLDSSRRKAPPRGGTMTGSGGPISFRTKERCSFASTKSTSSLC